jgi:hypothetical protein
LIIGNRVYETHVDQETETMDRTEVARSLLKIAKTLTREAIDFVEEPEDVKIMLEVWKQGIKNTRKAMDFVQDAERAIYPGMDRKERSDIEDEISDIRSSFGIIENYMVDRVSYLSRKLKRM